MNNSDIQLVHSMRVGPAVLLLGQAYLKLDTNKDSFLESILTKYNVSSDLQNYKSLFKITENSKEAVRTWAQKISENMSVSDSIKIIAQFPWSHVFTSSIDSILTRAFKTDLRTVQPIFNQSYNASNIRSKTNLHLTYLYGNIQYSEHDKASPLNIHDFYTRKATCNVLLGRLLPQIVTGKGVLLIDGWLNNDWLNFEDTDLYSALSLAGTGQIHLFSASENHTQHFLISELCNSGKLTLHTESLSSFLTRIQDQGLLDFSEISDESEGVWIELNNKRVRIPDAIRRVVGKSAIILHENNFSCKANLSKEQIAIEFRNFISYSTTIPHWSGYSSGFAFKRDFVSLTVDIVKEHLKRPNIEEPIVLHGQASSGKTIGMGFVAFELIKKNNLNAAVLFIERSYRRLDDNDFADIGDFCSWAEDNGAEKTIIFYDGMLSPEIYSSTLKNLGSRGRKVILVGTSYLLQHTEALIGYKFVEVPIEFTAPEKTRFSSYISLLIHDRPALEHIINSTNDKNFLSVLYHYLPESKSNISKLVRTEAKFVSELIQSKKLEFKNNTILAELLGELGFSETGEVDLEQNVFLGSENATLAAHFINLIMVIGKFGFSTPFELLIRALGTRSLQANFFKSIPQTDLIRWYEDHEGNISVGPRTTLEAKIYSYTLGGLESEVPFLKKIMQEIRDSTSSTQGDREIEFIILLLQELKKPGFFYRNYIYEYAKILGGLRESGQAFHPRLMLQEASLLQEAVKENLLPSTANRLDVLDIAEEVVRTALEIEKNGRSSTYIYLKVELASIIASKGKECSATQQKYAKDFFIEAREQIINFPFSSDNYHALDVILWTIRDETKVTNNEIERIKLYAEAQHFIQFAEEEGIASAHIIEFNKRKQELGQVFGDVKLSDAAFNELRISGSKIGYFLRAKEKLEGLEIWQVSTLNKSDKDKIEASLNYLMSKFEEIKNDSQCLYFMLKLWWLHKVQHPIFATEKTTLKLSQTEWNFLLTILNQLLNSAEIYLLPSLQYLKAICQFHLGEVNEAFHTFRELSEQTDNTNIGSRRIKKYYIASNDDGTPRVFSGLVEQGIDPKNNKGQILVNGLNKKVKLYYSDFRRNFSKDVTIEFYIAFNFIAPVAVPTKI